MSLTILGTPKRSRTDRAWKIQGYFQWSTTDLTGELPIDSLCPRIFGGVKFHQAGPIARALATAQYRSASLTTSVTSGLTLIAPASGVVSRFSQVLAGSVATSAAAYWSTTVTNLGTAAAGTAVVVDGTANANTSNASGSGYTASVERTFALTSTAADKTVVKNDVLSIVMSAATTNAVTLATPLFYLEITNTGGAGTDESVELDESALVNTTNGYLIPAFNTSITPNSLSVTVVRKSANPTSGAIYGFEYEGF